MRALSNTGRVGLLVSALCASTLVNGQSATRTESLAGRVWFDAAGGLNSRGFAIIPSEVSATTSVGLRYQPATGPLSFRVSGMARSSGSVNGQVAVLTTALISLPSRRIGAPGIAPYALLGAGWYGLRAASGGGGAHAGAGVQIGGQRQALMLEWARHSVFDVSQLTLGLGVRFR